MTQRGKQEDSAQATINAHKLSSEEIPSGHYVVHVARYAILPIANAKNPLLSVFKENGIKPKDLKKLYFLKVDPFDKPKKADKFITNLPYKPTLYTRAQKACAPIAFATNYGFEQDDILDKPIEGDDRHLITAVLHDTLGITYNNLNLIYDQQTRKVKPELGLIPVDINSNGKLDAEDTHYQHLDALIGHLEQNITDAITVEPIHLTYSTQEIENNATLRDFVDWILKNGDNYTHALGFLNLNSVEKAKQYEIFKASYLKP